jgi:polar amino acid transport system permease protein
MVRGVPDIVFFLFFILVLDQGIEYLRHSIVCPDWTDPIRQGANFIVCPEAAPRNRARRNGCMRLRLRACRLHLRHRLRRLLRQRPLRRDARRAPPAAGNRRSLRHDARQVFWRILVPQMWIYALPGLSNIWMILIKATPLLFLLGIEDIVYWARELGGSPHLGLPVPASRLALLVLPRPPDLLPRLHPGLRDRAVPPHRAAVPRAGHGGGRRDAEGRSA